MNISVIGGGDGPIAIFLAGNLGDSFFLPAIVIMIIFYGIYFTKKIVQKRRGIQTTQLGRGKEKTVRTIELIMSAATLLIVPIELVSIVLGWSIAPSVIRAGGIIIGLLGDLIFFVAVRTMKDSWRAGIPESDKTEFVTNGVYQYSRNPAFLGFDMMYIGILLMYFNWILFLFTIWVILMLHLQILQEEKYLATVFGEEYLIYKNCTSRYLGWKKISP